MRRLTAAVVPVGLALACSGCGDGAPSWGAPDPATAEGRQIRDLWQGFFVAGAVVAAIVWGLLVYVLVRYRRRNDEVPRQNAYNIPVEVLYTVAPIVAVAVLFGVSTAVQQDVTAETPAGDADVVVEVVGFQWQWRFTYPGEGGGDGIDLVGTPESGPPELVLPVDARVRFELRADDVIHSFWVPEFLEKRDLIPGVDNVVSLTTTRTGTFVGRCAEYCGLDHWRMGFSVRVVPQADYDDWVEEHAGA